MGVFSHKYTDEGYYTEDELGNLTKVFDKNELREAREADRLFYCDGYSMNIVQSIERTKKNRFDDMI